MEHTWTLEESESAHKRYEERRRQYMDELGINDKTKTRKSKARNFLEVDEDLSDLKSEDDDSDDEDSPSRYQTSNWRDVHKAAAHSTYWHNRSPLLIITT